jgi:hypothetical protein|nr:MAG TPA: hypothetical protein [Caudoviricetes sp.]
MINGAVDIFRIINIVMILISMGWFIFGPGHFKLLSRDIRLLLMSVQALLVFALLGTIENLIDDHAPNGIRTFLLTIALIWMIYAQHFRDKDYDN